MGKAAEATDRKHRPKNFWSDDDDRKRCPKNFWSDGNDRKHRFFFIKWNFACTFAPINTNFFD